MAKIAVTGIDDSATESHSLLRDLEILKDRIRERAYSIFERRGTTEGGALEHWLEAERDLTITPESNLEEKDSAFELSLAVDGFRPADLRVSALPGALIVQGILRDEQVTDEGDIESSGKTLYSRFDLPAAIRVDQVTARLDNGILRVTAPMTVLDTTSADKRGVDREKTPSARTAAA